MLFSITHNERLIFVCVFPDTLISVFFSFSKVSHSYADYMLRIMTTLMIMTVINKISSLWRQNKSTVM